MRTAPPLPTTTFSAHPVRWMPCCLLLALGLGGCNHPAPDTANAATVSAAPVIRSSAASQADAPTAAAAVPGSDIATRKGELTNPDNPTMVFLYYDLAGIAPPIDQ